jgi:WD40 repeat protein
MVGMPFLQDPTESKCGDLDAGVCTCLLQGVKHVDFQAVAVMPDGRRMVSLRGGSLRLWDLETKACLLELEQLSRIASASPDNEHVVLIGLDQTVRVLDLATGTYTSIVRLPGDGQQVLLAPRINRVFVNIETVFFGRFDDDSPEDEVISSSTVSYDVITPLAAYPTAN